jgi:orotidine-5'-phosphate decarboxylase
VSWFKVGSQLFAREGPRVCKLVKEADGKLFLDLKFHDIPHTVFGAVQSALALDADMLTVHASGGDAMLREAVHAVEDFGKKDVELVAVTVLTHLKIDDFVSMFSSNRSPREMVLTLASLAKECGLSGVVASARELRIIKGSLGDDFKVVTPGIRVPGKDGQDDQVRVVTPEEAIQNGADYIVVGRPIIAAEDPEAACRHILERVNGLET